MRRSRTLVLVSLVAVAAMLMVPAAAYALTNDYGQHFAGQQSCVSCHGAAYGETSHGRFMTVGAQPGTANFPVTSVTGAGMTINKSDIAFTLGDYAGGSATEYIKFDPALAAVSGSNPFLVLEGLSYEDGAWAPIDETEGISTSAYCGSRCHTIGATKPATKGETIPGASIVSQPTSKTPDAWARESTSDDLTDVASYVGGSSIQCEACHGTGQAATVDNGGHWNSGVKIVGYGTNTYAKAASTRILDSDICGSCHVNGSNKAGTLGTIGRTMDQPLRSYYNVADVVPTVASFTASPSSYKFYPNGANKSMHHSYYNEWNVSAHSYRGALTATSADASTYQKTTGGHFNAKTSATGCLKCHTGEGYLVRSGAAIMSGYTLSGATSGKYGTECAVCHEVHDKSGSSRGMSVRVSQFSKETKNPTTGSICEDCHNWQAEQMGSPVVGSDGRLVDPTPDAGHFPNHPTSEVVNGVGMYEIPAAGEFMPGIKCEQCHMPMTDETRLSHSFKIMLPGDAAAWGVQDKGDSCTPCHNESRAALQADIDSWQSMTASAAADTQAAYNAAKVRAASTYKVAGSADYVLMGRAWTNLNFYKNEGSMGAHNPYYIRDGLKAATKLAKSVSGTVALNTAIAPVPANTLVYISGVATNGDSTPAEGAKVVLEAQGTSSWTAVASATTGDKDDENGGFAFTVKPSVTTNYRIRWQRSADARADLVSSSVTVSVSGTPASKVEYVPIAGANRYATAIAAAEMAYPDGASNVVIATGAGWADALGGSALAGAVDGPMLLASSSSSSVLPEITKLGAKKAYILGGTSAVSSGIEAALKTKLGDANVVRLAGPDRYKTANLVADTVITLKGASYDGKAFFANGVNFPDALAAAPLAAAKAWPIYLVDPTKTDVVANTKVTDAIVLGGETAVSADFETALKAEFGTAKVARVYGGDRYATGVKVAAYGVSNAGLTWDHVAVATGLDFPDALAGGVLQGKMGSVLVLTPLNTLNAGVKSTLSANKATILHVHLLGGATVLQSQIDAALK